MLSVTHCNKAAELSIPGEHKQMIKGVEHIAIVSEDPENLAQWYVRNLDFTVYFRSGKTVFIQAANGYLFEVTPAEGERVSRRLKDPGLRHLAIAVDDFDAAYHQLKAAGVGFESEPFIANGNRVVFFTDPEGNYLHLIFRPTPLP